MDPVSMVGLGLSATGILSRLLGGGEEAERRKRLSELTQRIAEARAKALSEGTRRIVEQTQGAAAAARQGAARRAAASGNVSEMESYVLPAESRVYDQGTQATRSYMENVGRAYDQTQLEAEAGFAGRPIEPDFGDYLTEIGAGVTEFGQNQEYLNLMRENAEMGQEADSSVVGDEIEAMPVAPVNVKAPDRLSGVYQPEPVRPPNIFGYDPNEPSAKPYRSSLLERYRQARGF